MIFPRLFHSLSEQTCLAACMLQRQVRVVAHLLLLTVLSSQSRKSSLFFKFTGTKIFPCLSSSQNWLQAGSSAAAFYSAARFISLSLNYPSQMGVGAGLESLQWRRFPTSSVRSLFCGLTFLISTKLLLHFPCYYLTSLLFVLPSQKGC